jgi:hypothetical protein
VHRDDEWTRAQEDVITMNLCEDLGAVAEYIGFLRQKKAGQHHLKNMVGSLIKALVFLSATDDCGTGVDEKLTWLVTLKGQVSKLVVKPSKDSAQLKEEGG